MGWIRRKLQRELDCEPKDNWVRKLYWEWIVEWDKKWNRECYWNGH